jgi:hypothetical protein
LYYNKLIHFNRAEANASSARNKSERLLAEVKSLSRRVERQSLASQALWELLRDHTDFEEEHILEKMQEIDLRDGQIDGKIGHAPLTCSKCGRPGNSSRTVCVYCGASFIRKHVFE